MNWLRNLLGNKGVVGHKEVTTVDIHGPPLQYQICGYDYVWRHQAQLDTRGATFFNVE